MRFLALFGVAASVLACSSSANDASPTRPDAASDVSTKDTLIVDPETPDTCTACTTDLSGDPPAADYECIKSLDTELVDATDAKPVPNAVVQACSNGLCVHRPTDSDGKVHLVPCAYMLTPVFKVVGFAELVSFAIPLRNPQDTFTFTKVPVVRLPSTGIAFKVGEAQTLTMSGLTLETGTGAKNVEVDGLSAYTDFRATPIPDGKTAPGLFGTLGLEILWGLGPQNTLMSPPGKVTIPNTKGWAGGTAVEFWLHNFDLLTDVPVKMGEWWKVATGTVSPDGKTISTDTGQGLPMLSLFGVRKKP